MSTSSQPLNIVTIGGGSGQFALLNGLKDLEDIAITAVVSMVDSGGSTGRLRGELGILPPGDVLKCIVALSAHQEAARTILLKRFQADHRLHDHSAGNMLLSALSRYAGSFSGAVSALGELLEVKGIILPVTVDQATLVAELTDGSRIYGERAIDTPGDRQCGHIRDVFLVPHHNDNVQVFPPVLEAIDRADVIILGPGDLYTSIIPNLVVPGVAEALQNSRATLMYVISIMTKFGETHQFSGLDFVHHLEHYLRRNLDVVIANQTPPPDRLREKYAREKSECVPMEADSPQWGRRRLQVCDLLDITGDIIRHDSKKLADMLASLFPGSIK